VGGVQFNNCQFWYLNRPSVVLRPPVKGVHVTNCQEIKAAGTTPLNLSI